MRVLTVVEATGAGVGRHVCDLLHGLREQNIDVHLVYSPNRMDHLFSQDIQSLGDLPSMQFPMRTGPHPTDYSATRAIKRYVRENGPFEIIHGHSSKGGALARLAAFGNSSKAVFTPHASVIMNPVLPFVKKSIYGACELLLARATAALIALTPEEQSVMQRWTLLPSSSIHIVPNAIESPTFLGRQEARQQLGIAEDKIVVGFVGRLGAQKNPQLAIDAIRKTHSSNVVLAMIGDGELAVQLADRVQREHLSDKVKLLGSLRAMPLLQAFDMLVMSSLYEGMPYVLLEAAHAGLPIVSTDVSGASSVIEPGVTGFITPQNDSTALSHHINLLSENGSLRTKIGAAAKERVQQHSLRQMIEDTLAVYKRIGE